MYRVENINPINDVESLESNIEIVGERLVPRHERKNEATTQPEKWLFLFCQKVLHCIFFFKSPFLKKMYCAYL